MKASTKRSNAGLVASDIGPLKFAPVSYQQSCLRSKSPGNASPERNQGQAEIAQPNGSGIHGDARERYGLSPSTLAQKDHVLSARVSGTK